ncbi:MAG: FAD-dependent oxidoreductase [Candidatus Glassbacteria bacterium]|nr:FAD-dependent oxidoreductase [Candidatus Glassbacteria bacterium]
MRFLFVIMVTVLAALSACAVRGTGPKDYDVVVYGATPGGIAAALAAARMGERVCLVAVNSRVGGMMASGLGNTDAGNPDFIGGISAEVFAKIAAHYRRAYGETSPQYAACRDGLRFEPHVAEAVFEKMLADEEVELLRAWRLIELDASLNRINSILLRRNSDGSQRSIEGRFFIDATYTGDLFAEAGCPFYTGREGREVFDESLAGHLFQHHETRLPLPGSTHEGDSLIQAYNYRLCLTDSVENSVPWPEPENYKPGDYRVLCEFIRLRRNSPRSGGELTPRDFLNIAPLPNRKYDLNNYGHCWLSTDLVGGSQGYPLGTWRERAGIEKAHREHILGLWKFLRTDPGIPAELRAQFDRYRLAADEFTDNGNWPFQIYVREARRLHGEVTFTQHDATVDTLKNEAVGIGSYPMDSHATGPVRREYRWREGFFILPSRPYQIPYRIMVPTWMRNLLVPVCVSASHVGYGTLRLEPVWMIMGHAAGTAASICLEFNCEVGECPVPVLQRELRSQGQIIAHDQAAPWTDRSGTGSR